MPAYPPPDEVVNMAPFVLVTVGLAVGLAMLLGGWLLGRLLKED